MGQDRTFTPIGPFIDAGRVKDPQDLMLRCDVNGQNRQMGNTKDMIFKIPFLLRYLSTILDLRRGDVILTGTPAGVGPLKAGDKVVFGLAGHGPLPISVEEDDQPEMA